MIILGDGDEAIDELLRDAKAKEAVKTILVEGTSVAMNRFNRRKRFEVPE